MKWLRWLSMVLVAALLIPLADPLSGTASAQGACWNTLYQPLGKTFWVATPATANVNGPVLVFVHGYTSDHSTWTGGNYAVQHACEQGFRVAAVDLGPKSSIWENGAQLTSLLQEITSFYGVSTVSIVAHSKGSVDTQTAIVHAGGAPYVDSYLTFGGPFGGTELANVACSAFGTLLDLCNDATLNLRTGYMSYVRSITDGRPENEGIAAFAARGTRRVLIITCLLIPGSDDGVVPAWSAWASAGDTHISDRSDLNHFQLHQTEYYDQSWLFSLLGPDVLPSSPPPEAAHPHFPSSQYTMRAGIVDAAGREQVVVESGLRRARFDLLANDVATVEVISPSGRHYTASAFPSEEGALLQGIHHVVTIARPEVGEWAVAVRSDQRGTGYLLTTSFEGGLSVTLNQDGRALYSPGEALALDLRSSDPLASRAVEVTLRDDAQRVLASSSSAGEQVLRLPTRSGVYSVEMVLQGTLPDGAAVERTLVTSLAVVAPGESLR